MRSVIRLGVVATLAIGAVAFETTIAQADGYGAAPRLAPQPYNWSGLYVGGAAGYAWGDGLTDMSVSGVFIQRASPDLNGGIWGGHIGLNYQMGALVVGAEAQWLSGLDGSELAPAFPPPSNLLIRGTVDVSSFQLFKARLGYAWDRWLPYVTGGYATGQVTSRFRDFNFNGGIPVVSDKQRHGGWVLGAGVEYAITNNVIIGVEYLHIDLEDEIHAGFNNFGGAVPPRNHLVNADADVITARLSFKFGERACCAPVPLK
jgi:outer membrane immunogenic protein